ncbi:MAG: tail fiber domain-containing protein [Bacteroidia bacterium]|nr:tail fiber domain-containing protein [Bacteroidia bacterium]
MKFKNYTNKAMLIACITASNLAQAQWTENASSVYLTSGTKNVGIGTFAPAFAIDVQRTGNASAHFKSVTGTCNLIIDRGNSAATSSVSYRTAGVPTWQTGTMSTDNFVIRNISLGAPALAVNNSNNNVGIGTNAPAHKLTINTDNLPAVALGLDNRAAIAARNAAGVYENFLWPRENDNRTYLNYGSAGMHIRNNASTSTIFLSNDNNVGIGTATPTSKLHVIGSGFFQGNLHVTNNASFGASIGISGDVTATGTVTGNKLAGNTADISGNITMGDTLFIGSVERIIDAGGFTLGCYGDFVPETNAGSSLGQAGRAWSQLHLTSNANIGGNVTVTGSASIGNGINVIAGNISSGGDLYTSSGNGVINCGGDSMSAFINVLADNFTPGTSNLNANGDEDLYIGGDLEVTLKGYQTGGGAWGVRSDARLKKDVVDFTDGLDALLKIRPVKFKYNNLMPNHTEQEYVGIIAQEMQEIAPYMVEEKPMGQIVEEDANGKEVIVKQGTNYLSYDPNALWYITVNAVKEQQKIIEKQAERIEALEALLKDNATTTHRNTLQTVTSKSTIEQNQPNPFNQSTVINYNLTDDNAKAHIIIRDLSGNMLKKCVLGQRGKGQVVIQANEFAQGTYTYSLEVNGQSIDTKLMVIVN